MRFRMLLYLLDIYLQDIRSDNVTRSKKTRYAILGILSQESLSGYEIKKLIEERLSFYWNESYGQIYPTLKELQKEGFLESNKVSQQGRPDKNVYRLTESGLAILRDWLEEPIDSEWLRLELLLKLSFGNQTSMCTNRKRIERFRESVEQRRRLMELFELNLKEVIDDHPDHPYQLVTVIFGKKTYQAWLDWCEEALALLEDSEARLEAKDNG